VIKTMLKTIHVTECIFLNIMYLGYREGTIRPLTCGVLKIDLQSQKNIDRKRNVISP